MQATAFGKVTVTVSTDQILIINPDNTKDGQIYRKIKEGSIQDFNGFAIKTY